MWINGYRLDVENCVDGDLVVDIPGRGSVIIKSNEDGVSIDVYPLHSTDEPLMSFWLASDDFEQGEEE